MPSRPFLNNHFFKFLFLFCIFGDLYAQEIPDEFLENDVSLFSLDAGNHWEKHTLFGPLRYQTISGTSRQNSDSLQIHSRLGFQTINQSIALYGFGRFTYHKSFYAYLYPRIVNDLDAFPRYSGVPRDITRGGFNSGETDLSGIGYQNEWMTMQIGRGRESWGAGQDIQLALSKKSPSYDYGMIKLELNSIRVKYIHGFLESTEDNINRYITARGFEWTNKKSLILALSETVIYSGENRPIDIGYMNPMSTHLEIELNERLNTIGTGSANAVWQASLDWMIQRKFRVSGNFLFDEFVIDAIEKEAGKEHGMAYSSRFSYVLNPEINLFTSYVKVGTPTFRHGSGTNNFVQRNQPLGWEVGSDGKEWKTGLNYSKGNILFIRVTAGKRERGSESITSRPYDSYEDYLAGPFPSGIVERTEFINTSIKWAWKSSIQFDGKMEWEKRNKVQMIFGVNIYFPKEFKI